jgi:2-polyprenyl-6-methoxyphenol hydroxylase-like FAD-dependent oxidoreductase
VVASLEAAPLHHSAAKTVLVEPVISERVVLVGDAAHGCSPSLAQGLAAALEDAAALAAALEGAPCRTALDNYANRRRDVLAYLHRTTRLRTQVARLPEERRRAKLKAFGKATGPTVAPMKVGR